MENEVTDWQPIETAPQTGSALLCENGNIFIGHCLNGWWGRGDLYVTRAPQMTSLGCCKSCRRIWRSSKAKERAENPHLIHADLKIYADSKRLGPDKITRHKLESQEYRQHGAN